MKSMRKVSDIAIGQNVMLNSEDYECPFCHRQQIINPIRGNFGSFFVIARQCLSCKNVSIQSIVNYYTNNSLLSDFTQLYPIGVARSPSSFAYAPKEIDAAYKEACGLVAHHIGAAGAYARRALELILDAAGYQKATLASSIEAAGKEKDGEKKLPKRLLTKLDYVKEIGNFALHVRRDGELAIVEIDSDEVEACLEIIEELVTYMFEEPGRDRARTEALNVKLKASGKKEIALPPIEIAADAPAREPIEVAIKTPSLPSPDAEK